MAGRALLRLTVYQMRRGDIGQADCVPCVSAFHAAAMLKDISAIEVKLTEHALSRN